ncbi:MAG: hypothetical protein ACLFM7_11875 [Bacteroidales bacterium]
MNGWSFGSYSVVIHREVGNGQLAVGSWQPRRLQLTETNKPVEGVSLEPLLFHEGKSRQELKALSVETGIELDRLLSENEITRELTGKITQAHDPPLYGKERIDRWKYYKKSFLPMDLGT